MILTRLSAESDGVQDDTAMKEIRKLQGFLITRLGCT